MAARLLPNVTASMLPKDGAVPIRSSIFRPSVGIVQSQSRSSQAAYNRRETATFASLDKYWIVVFGVFTIVLAYVGVTLALQKPFWNDEIYTILIAGLPSLSAIWRATEAGMDLMPPLNSTLTHGIHALVGAGPLATRLPALVGYWTMTLVVFDLVRRRSHVVAALSAAVLPSLTEAFRYSTEARGYGLMLGLFAVALWSWSEAARVRKRRFHLPLLGLALAAALWTQYFAVLAFVPIGIGEAVRWHRSRRVDWGVAGAAGAALIAALPLRALMPAAAARAATFWSHASIGDIGPTYGFLFAPLASTAVLISLGLAALLGAIGMAAGNRAPLRCQYPDLPPYEIAAGVATLAVPLGAVLLSVYGVGAFVPRYALAGVIGLSVALPLAVARTGSRRGSADLVLCTALVATFCGAAYSTVGAGQRGVRHPVATRPLLLEQLSAGQTVAVSGTTEFLQLWYYSPAEVRGRLVYLADPAAALALTGTDTLDRDYLAVREWSSVPVLDYEGFITRHADFLVYDFGNGWLARRLRASGAAFEEVGRERDAQLYRVTLPIGTSVRGH